MIFNNSRCLDAHGGYLYHTPERTAKIVMTCAALHNIGIEWGIPIMPDNDVDAFHPLHNDPGQPPHALPPQRDQLNFVDRRNYIFHQF